MALLSVPELREHVETDLPDSAVQALIDDADAEIVRRYGPHRDAANPLSIRLMGGHKFLFLTRPIETVDSITETAGGVETELAADDYRVWYEGFALQRRSDGTNVASVWGEEVVIAYVPQDDTAIRQRVAIDLVRLAVQYQALRNERVGDYNAAHVDYREERELLLAAIQDPRALGVQN